MGFLSSLLAYLTVVAAFSGMMLATFFYLTLPPDHARTGAPEAKRSAEARPAAQQASAERGRMAARKTTAAEAKAAGPAAQKAALPAAAEREPTTPTASNASTPPADRTLGSGPSEAERKLSLSEQNVEAPAPQKPAKKVKKRAKKQPAVARRSPPARPSFEQWNGRFAGPPMPDRPSYYGRPPYAYDRGPYPYERGPFWYR